MKQFHFVFIVILMLFSACDRCADVRCINGGACEKGECECLDGYSGDRCEVEDKCVTGNTVCQNGGTCQGGKCDCPEGFGGANCTEEDLCITADPNCRNGGVCDDGECDCPLGFSGDRCEIVDPGSDPCDTITCLNGGECVDGECDCPTGWTGNRCQFLVDPCDTVSCQNDQPCEDGSCICDQWTEGTYCQTKVINQYVGWGQINGTWYDSGGSYFSDGYIRFYTNTSDTRTLDMEIDIVGNTLDVYVDFSDRDSFSYPTQTTGGFSISGDGDLDFNDDWNVSLYDGSATYYFEAN